MTPQLFNFNQFDVRVICREDGDYWFIAKDAAAALDIDWSDKTLDQIHPEWKSQIS